MVLREETSVVEKPLVRDAKAIMWTCTLSAPEMTTVLYNSSGLPLYHVSGVVNSLPNHASYSWNIHKMLYKMIQ